MCGLIGGICLLLSITKVYAADCIIEIQLEDLKVPWSDRENVIMALYDVGDVSAEGEPELDPSFGITQYPQTADDSRKAVEQIERRLTKEPILRQQTDAQGRASFSGISDGVYLIKAEQTENYGIIISSLTHLPYYEVVNDEKQGPLYTVRVNPKASRPNKPETPTDTPKPSGKPGTEVTPTVIPEQNGNQGGGNGGSGSGGSNIPGKSQSVKTGDESRPAELLGLLGVSAALAGAVICKRRKVSE